MKYLVKREGMPPRKIEAADEQAACQSYDAEFGIRQCNRPFSVEAATPTEPPAEEQPESVVPVTPRPPLLAMPKIVKKVAKKSAEPKT